MTGAADPREHAEAQRRLAVYGTLRPGGPNHHHMAGMRGTWTPGVVHGHLHESGWGAAMGYPGIVLDPQGPPVPVQLFDSSDLPQHWPRLDDFEGPGYERVTVTVRTGSGDLAAMIYALAPDAVPDHGPPAG